MIEFSDTVSCLSISGFLTAVLQNHARKLGISVDSLFFTFSILPPDDETDLNDIKHKLDVRELGFKVGLYPEWVCENAF